MKIKSMLLVACAAALTVAIPSPAVTIPSTAVTADAAPQRIEIHAKRFSYTPNEITVKKGQPVVLVLKSEDVGHGLRIRDFGINLQVKAGGTAEVTFTPDKVGDFVAHCSVFCGAHHGSMMLTLHVVA